MLSRKEFKNRFITHMVSLIGRDDRDSYGERAEGCYGMYLEDPDHLTPEQHAEEEIEEWGR